MNQQTSHYDAAEEHPFGDAGQVIFVIVFFVVWIVDSFILKLTTFPAVHAPFLIRVLLGICSASLGFVLLRTHTAGYTRLGISVVMDGPYRFIRHPIYASVLLIVLGPAIATLSIAGLVVWSLFFIFYNHISAYEEKILLEKFGKEYADYMKKVPRWIPGMGRK
jgi:protein-S-isoprenylcysteine O-methyltransferase Ste14